MVSLQRLVLSVPGSRPLKVSLEAPRMLQYGPEPHGAGGEEGQAGKGTGPQGHGWSAFPFLQQP